MRTLTTLCAAMSMLAPTAWAQTATFSVVLSTPGPVQNGATVHGSLWIAWNLTGGYAYEGGAFRLRMDGLGPSDVNLPTEPPSDYIAVPGGDVFWTDGRRPPYFLGSDIWVGGFRLPRRPQYTADQEGGAVFLDAGGGPILHSQDVFEAGVTTDAQFELFRFSVRAPLVGRGEVTITPDALVGNAVDGAGHLVPLVATGIPAAFTFVPDVPTLSALLILLPNAGRSRRSVLWPHARSG
jgi:hypothetical protein